MNRFFLILILFFSCELFPQDFNEEITQTLTKTLLSKNSISESHLSNQIFLSFNNTNGFFGKNQLIFKLNKFLKENNFQTIRVLNSSFDNKFAYLFFIVSNGHIKYNIYFSININKNEWLIDQITIKDIP